MILQLHKFQVELEESKQKHSEQTERIKTLETKNEDLKNDINELTKTKERLTEQSGFLQKSLEKKKVENNELLERLKQAEIQLGESGSVLATMRNLESKNELLNEKMSNVLHNTEEEIAKVKAEREHYMKLSDETSELNKRSQEIQNKLVKARETADEHTEKAKVHNGSQINISSKLHHTDIQISSGITTNLHHIHIQISSVIKYYSFLKTFVEKSEKICTESTKTLDEIQRAKQQFVGLNSDRVKSCLKENAFLQKENNELKQKTIDQKTQLNRQEEENQVLKAQLVKMEDGKTKLLKEIDFLQR